ncbi:Sterol 3-beta-glucosyltransferase [Puccinia graminis f. sp. tritici]|uniref:Sterol 3-beta-glucosyltransferase n=1 Tax=Puccinia graminis f. sp. tritici TaxID=56615 RepID=A0A5B0QMF1_PUCGR|nr:Sterol 3-beta-glucosyltransferase [Puccinia graminis f. sp. tritici]
MLSSSSSQSSLRAQVGSTQDHHQQEEHTFNTNSIPTKASSIFAIHRSLFLDQQPNQHPSKHAHSETDNPTHPHSTEEPTESDSEYHTSTPPPSDPHSATSYINNSHPTPTDTPNQPHQLSTSLPDLTPSSPSFNQSPSTLSNMSNTLCLRTQSPKSRSSHNRRHQHDHNLAAKRSQILSRKLQQVFQLPSDEKLLAEYPSWLFRSLLLKGYVYLTTAHVCFYAFLKSNEREVDEEGESIKAGILTRRHSRKLNQRQTVKSWFILKNTILSWYPSSQEIYFPTGQIDLHFCTKVEPAPANSKHPNQFKLFVSGKVYTFFSDTQQSKDEWVKSLQQTIFACQHNGQNVKIAIPLSSIASIEKCDSIQFAQTVCIKIKENAPALPFAPNRIRSPQVVPEEIGDSSLVDYFFGFLQDSQTPYELLRAALERVQASSSSALPTTISDQPPPESSLTTSADAPSRSRTLSPIRDSTRFRVPSTPLPRLRDDYFATSALGLVSRSGSQTPISSDAPSNLASEERKTSFKFTDKISKIASSGNKFVGSPIRPAFNNTVKVRTPTSANPIGLGPRPIDSPTCSSTQDPKSLPMSSASPSTSESPPQEQLPSQSFGSPQLDKLNRSSTGKNPLAQSHTYPPKERRSHYSTYSPRERSDSSTPVSALNSPRLNAHESPSVDPNKSWTLLPGWLKNVPTTLNPIKPAKDVINSAKGLMTSAQDPSSSTSTVNKKEPPSRSPSAEKLSDEEGTSRLDRGAQLTQRDQIKFQTEFNFLTTGVVSNSTNPEGPIRLLLKTKCNLLRSGSSMYGQVYLASPVPAQSLKQKTARKSCVCFKGQKWISSAPVKMILPVEALTAVRAEALKLYLTTQKTDVLADQGEVCFEFASAEQIKAVHDEITRMIESNKHKADDGLQADNHQEEEEEEDGASLPIMFESSSSSFLTFKPKSKLHITCLTIGSRGDVQPYIALCQKLQLDGHRCRIASHGEYRKWVEGYGIEYVEIGGDPAELMKICVDNGMFTLGFLKEAFSKFRGWLDELLVSSFEACRGTDLLIESPSTMAGIHIAEALQIPYFRAFTMPWTRTKEYPHAFAVPDRKMGSGYNYMTYTVFDQVFWKAMSGQVNKWRKEKLGLKSTTYEKLEVHKVPFLYNFSPSIVPAPLDWYEWIHVTGYWFIDEDDPNKTSQQALAKSDALSDSLIDNLTSSPPVIKPSPQKTSWNPPQDLTAFLDRAHTQNKKVVYIGFGSIVVPDPEAMTKVIIESVKSAGVYAIVSKGWSERLSGSGGKKAKRAGTSEEEGAEAEDQSMIYHINSIPHDWLFPRIDAVCHHGGSGTTGASLRAGIPTIIKPFFGDQFFWAERVESLGIGAGLRKLTVKNLSNALSLATSDATQISRARIVGELIRAENGAAKAVECIYRDLDYARSLIKRRPTQLSETTPATANAPAQNESQTNSLNEHLSTAPGPSSSTNLEQAETSAAEGGKKETSEHAGGDSEVRTIRRPDQEEAEDSGQEANESSLLLMSAHSSVSTDHRPPQQDLPPSQHSSDDFFDCPHPPPSSEMISSVRPPSPPPPPSSSHSSLKRKDPKNQKEDEGNRPQAVDQSNQHTLMAQKSDTTIVPKPAPLSHPVQHEDAPPVGQDPQKVGQINPSDQPKGKQTSSALADDEHHLSSDLSDSSSSSWDILSQQSKSDPASVADLSTSFDQF